MPDCSYLTVELRLSRQLHAPHSMCLCTAAVCAVCKVCAPCLHVTDALHLACMSQMCAPCLHVTDAPCSHVTCCLSCILLYSAYSPYINARLLRNRRSVHRHGAGMPAEWGWWRLMLQSRCIHRARCIQKTHKGHVFYGRLYSTMHFEG